jgi:hypothetical protein
MLSDVDVAHNSIPPPPEETFQLKQDGSGASIYRTPMFGFGHRRDIYIAKMRNAYAGVGGDETMN